MFNLFSKTNSIADTLRTILYFDGKVKTKAFLVSFYWLVARNEKNMIILTKNINENRKSQYVNI